MSNDFNNKRYYWIKLKDSFMTSDKVDYLMSQKNGANYIVLYQMLCLKAINTDGELARQVGEILMPFDAEKIQRDCKWFDIDTVRVALELYKNLGLVFIQESGILKITDFENLVGSETQSNIYKKNKQLENFQPNSNKRLDIRDKDIRDKNTDKDIPPLYISPPEGENTQKKSTKRFVKPTVEEIKEYCTQRNNNVDANQFYDFYESKGWVVGKAPMKDWRAAVRLWESNRNSSNSANQKTSKTSEYDYLDNGG